MKQTATSLAQASDKPTNFPLIEMKAKNETNETACSTFVVNYAIARRGQRRARTRTQTPTQTGNGSYGSATDGTPLTWDVKMPPGKTKVPWILSISSGHWVDENGVPPNAVQKILNAGWASVHVFHRLAPPNTCVGQVGDGRYPEQTDDVTMAVEAARKDPRCDSRIAAIGGSGGANLTLVLQAKGKVVCAVGFSPATDLQALVAGGGQPAQKALNYATNNQARINASPVTYLQRGVSVPGMSVFFTTDQMPDTQRTIWNTKTAAIGLQNRAILLPGAGHSWAAEPLVDWIGFIRAHVP